MPKHTNQLHNQNEEIDKRAAELNENKTLLASVLDSSLSGIMAFKSIRNAEDAITDFEWQLVNAAAEQMVSRSQTEIVGKRLLEEMPGNRAEGLFDLYVRVVETGIPLSHEHYYEHEKVKTWFHTVAIKRLDGFVVTFSNITERKLAEQELIIANKELAFQNEEKEKRAAELVLANKELAFQNEEKEKRAAELVIANKELAFQNEEKEKRAAELVVANKELVFQNEEKEKRATELSNLFTELKHSEAQLFAAYDSTIEGWSHALDLRDKETEGHTQRVTEITMKLTHAAGMTEAELVHVRRGALLHDIGKMGVPDHILLKPDKLTDEEWVAMRKHPTFAFELLSPIAYLRPALDIPYCHHEKWDGSGYPRGLKGDQIPLAARLFAIVDVWDALLYDRPYRQGWSKEKVIEHIKSLSGTHFEPKAMELFLNMMNEDEKNAG